MAMKIHANFFSCQHWHYFKIQRQSLGADPKGSLRTPYGRPKSSEDASYMKSNDLYRHSLSSFAMAWCVLHKYFWLCTLVISLIYYVSCPFGSIYGPNNAKIFKMKIRQKCCMHYVILFQALAWMLASNFDFFNQITKL